jgi:hypothetical protein
MRESFVNPQTMGHYQFIPPRTTSDIRCGMNSALRGGFTAQTFGWKDSQPEPPKDLGRTKIGILHLCPPQIFGCFALKVQGEISPKPVLRLETLNAPLAWPAQKAALKPHAVQTLRVVGHRLDVAKRLDCARFIAALGTGAHGGGVCNHIVQFLESQARLG